MEGRPVALAIGAVVSIAVGLLFVAVPFFSEPRVDPVVGSVAFGGLYAMPGILALVGRRGRPGLVLAATFMALALTLFLISIVSLAMIVPAACLAGAYGRLRGSAPRRRDALVAIVVVAVAAVSVPILLASEDPRCWARVRGARGNERIVAIEPDVHNGVTTLGGRNEPRGTVESGCTSDVVSTTEGLGVLAVLSGAFGIGLALTSDRRWGGGEAPDRLPSPRAWNTR